MLLLAALVGGVVVESGYGPEGLAQAPEADRARSGLAARIAEALHLANDKALALGDVLRAASEDRRRLRARRRELEVKVRAALARSPIDQAELATLVAEGNAIDQDAATLPQKCSREVQKLLTVEQQARLIVLRPELLRELRSTLRRRQEPRGGRSRRPPPERDE